MCHLIVEYLLFLAKFQSAYDRHKTSEAEARAAMTEFGLNEHQQKVILSEKNDEIKREIDKEHEDLNKFADEKSETFDICMSFCIRCRH